MEKIQFFQNLHALTYTTLPHYVQTLI